ncbi:Short-chain dehydrogenase reductase 3b [Cladophialophora carrionii]|uniref:Short-chain dehydrogenase reductase 3b n=1 Tax=Cladophialophora carrionii TaxID=86049 RepID=A0A1C1CIY7_9EURO|nr:Short-chain dehydrogenase reductase 3b [Cladophialophora carrionii]
MANEAFTISRDKLTGPRDSTILVTGGSSGIGLQTVILLHELGNNVIVVDRARPSPAAPTSLTSSPRFLYQQCDITSWKQQRAAFEAGVQKFGSIDCVFVNAGIAEYKDQFFKDELDADGLLKEPDRRVVDIDMHAANDTAKLAIHYIRKKGPEKKRGGSIVMTASLAGYLASAGAPLYSAAKHGIVGLMRALKNDTATLGIAVSVVAPGITLTDIISGRKPGESLSDWAQRMRALGVPINDPQEIANAVVYLMSLGMEGNGKGLLIQAGRVADLEKGIATSRKIWMGTEMLDLFRGGRNAPLFPNKL